eukprot:COSAG01_NODE_176_length_22957_cov_72.262096_24_plen_404_part_00
MENPLASSASQEGVKQQQQEGAPATEGFIACPNYLSNFDRLLSTPNGRPSLFFGASMLSIALLSSCWLAGTFFTPGLQLAYERRDPLLAFVALSGWFNTGPCYFVLFTETRRLVRSGSEGELPQMGVGRTPISPELHTSLMQNKRKNYAGSVPGFGLVILLGNCALAALFVSGKGVHSELHNRMATAVFMFFFCTGDAVYHVWLLTLKTATTLVSAKARAIIATIDTAGDEPMSDEAWGRQILDPCRDLIETLDLLSRGWAPGTLAFLAYTTSAGFCAVCVQLTPWTREQENQVAIRAVAAFLLLGFSLMTFLVILGPATVSSECDELKERLNKRRINSFDVDSHNRLLILETAMEKSNHGQGIGFCVLGVVIDKPRLWAYTNKFMGLVTFIAPFLATWSADQ